MALALVALACLVGSAFAGPFQREPVSSCSVSCPQDEVSSKFQYQPGSKYVYDYRGTNLMAVAGKRMQKVSELSCIAEISVRDRCQMTLQLKNIRLSQEGVSIDELNLQQPLEIPLPFSWVDGKIEHVCASPEETVASENIKKSILSTIINTMDDLQSPSTHPEVDSFGACGTKYTVVRQLDDGAIIKKEKSLKSCNNSQAGFSAVISDEYSAPESEVNSVSIFTHEKRVCEQEIRQGLIQRVTCKENAAVKPMSKYDSVMEFEANVQLKLKNVQQQSKMPEPSSSHEKKSILYSFNQEQDDESKEHEAVELLREICPLTEGLLQPKVSKLYYELIMVLKGLPADAVQRLYESLKSKRLCQSQKTLDIFLDALPMAGTEGSIQLMVHLLKTKQVDGVKANLWPASFALIPNPNAEAIAAVLPLVSEEEISRPVLLGLSAMIHRICSRSQCDRIPSVKEAVRVLHQTLGQECSNEDDDKVISILKAFGNMGYLGEAQSTILQCAAAQHRHISIRLAAVDAFRRHKQGVPQELIDLYLNSEENFEVRIAAISTMIKQANEQVKSAIQQVLDNDKDIQVVAYTMSLLNNWQKTSSPLKQEVRELLQEIDVKRSDIGYWENSKNIELSAFNEPMNLGASAESNIIHSSESKIPRAFSSKLDVDLFGKNVNLFEFGARAEGLEKTVKKILGVEGSSSSSKKSWFPLSSRQDSDEEKPEASFYLRTMGTEFMDLTVSDLTSVGSMMQVADVFNKLARGTKVDNAHSFLFLNTKLVVQSVTGRSYTFGMTGSATAALTADGKFDILNLFNSPSNCDIEGRLQPSANLEFATTVGIHSQKSRPDIKIVTTFHTGVDVGAKLKVKDSHLAEARLDMPSDEIQLLKISTELYEIDEHNNEKRIIEHMEKKIDRCIRALEKPLGIQICAQLETPKPFVSRNFPYAHGIGNLQLSIKKTDRSMKGYSASIEIPKRASDSMLYKVAFDTPGSSINRKFQANLELKYQQQGEGQFKLEMKSPFKEITSTGTIQMRKDLLQCSANLITDSRHRYSAKAVVEMDMNGPKKLFKPTIQWTLPGQEPASIAGSITYDQGRKQHLMIDFRSLLTPNSKPLVLTGNLVKEGRMGWSKSDQWKLSADLVAKCPFITAKIHTAHNKRSGQSETISSAFTLDYSRHRSSKHSIKFSSEVHQSTAKTGASAQFESTQMPQYNWDLSWDMQGKLKSALKNEIMVKYGQRQESHYVQISQTYRHGDRNTLSQCTASIKAPHLDIDSDLQLAIDLHGRETSSIHVEADLRYKEQKHIKSLIQMKRISQKPIKMFVKAALEYPGRQMSYEDEIVETSQNVYEGQSKLQWQRNQKATLRYTYKRNMDRNVLFHHEFESTLNTPVFRTPVTQKSLLKLTRESFEIKSEVTSNQRLTYSVEAKLKKEGSSHLSVRTPSIKGKLQLDNEHQKKSADLDLILNKPHARHVTAASSVSWGAQKSVMVHCAWDADSNPSMELGLNAELEIQRQRSGVSYKVSSKVQCMDMLKLDLSSSGEQGIRGPHQVAIEISGLRIEPLSVRAQQQITPESIRLEATFKKNNVQKLVAEMRGTLKQKSSVTEISASASLQSPDRSFENRRLTISHSSDKSRSLSFVSEATLEKEQQVHNIQIKVQSPSRESKELRIVVKTPYQDFQEQELRISHQRRDQDTIINEAELRFRGKKVSMSSAIKKNRNEASIACSLSTPYSTIKDLQIYAGLENQREQKHLESHLELNGERKYDVAATYQSRGKVYEFESSMKSSITPEISINMKSDISRPSFSHELVISKDSTRFFSCKATHQQSGAEFKSQLEMKSARQVLLDLKAMKEAKSTASTKYTVKAKGPFTPVSMTMQSIKSEENSVSRTLQVCREVSSRQCYTVKGYYRKEKNSDKYSKYRKITFDIEQEIQGSVQHICNVHYQLSVQDRNIKSQFLVESQDKKIGYELAIESRKQEQQPCRFDLSLILPSRTMKIASSALHNSEKSLFEVELSPDTSNPSQALTLQFKRDFSERQGQTLGHIKMSHQSLSKPLLVKYHLVRSKSMLPQSCKLEVEYSSNPQDKIEIELDIQPERSRQRQQIAAVKIISSGNDLDLAVTVSKQEGRNNIYVCQWSWKSQRGQKSGELKAKFSDTTRKGWPRNAEIKYTSQSAEFSLDAQTVWTETWPSQAQMQLKSRGRLLGELQYQQDGKCYKVELKNPEPFWRNKLCIAQNEQQLQLISFQAHHEEKKCLDFNIAVDPTKSRMLNIGMQWDKRELQHTLKSLQQMTPSVRSLPWRQIEQEIRQKCQMICQSLKSKVLKPLAASLQEETSKLKQEIRETQHLLQNLPQLPEMPSLKQLQEMVQKFYSRYYEKFIELLARYIEENAPEWVKECVEKIKEFILKFMRRYCSRDTFCYKLMNTYERYGLRKVKQLLKSTIKGKMYEAQKSSSKKYSEVSRWFEIFTRDIKRWVEKLFDRIPFNFPSLRKLVIFEKLSEYYDELKHYLKNSYKEYYEKVVEWFDKFLDKAMENDIFKQLAQHLKEIKKEAFKYWKNLDIKSILESWKQTAFEKIRRSWIQQRINIQEYNTSEGRMKIQMYNPMDKSKMQLLRNAIVALKNKYTTRQ